MRILNQNNIEVTSPDLSLGYLVEEEIFIKHHDAIDAIEEQWHYETIKEYPNGGKDVEKVIDVPHVPAREAYDEYETIQRYILYTEEELLRIEAERNKPSLEDRMSALEETVNTIQTQDKIKISEYEESLLELGIEL